MKPHLALCPEGTAAIRAVSALHARDHYWAEFERSSWTIVAPANAYLCFEHLRTTRKPGLTGGKRPGCGRTNRYRKNTERPRARGWEPSGELPSAEPRQRF
jgi:hypothetical protein